MTMLTATVAVSYQAGGREAGDPGKGLVYASRICAQCHAVRRGDNFSKNPLAPSFEHIWISPDTTGISLAAALHAVHKDMPNYVLKARERDSIFAYILSLKKE